MRQKLKVLLVADEDAVARFLQAKLVQAGMGTLVVGQATRALLRVSTELFDCIVLDLNFSDMPGFVFLVHLQDCGAKAPVIVMTGVRDAGFRQVIQEFGVASYLEKPFKPEHLIERIEYVTTFRRSMGGSWRAPFIRSEIIFAPGNAE